MVFIPAATFFNYELRLCGEIGLIAAGEQYLVREFVKIGCNKLGMSATSQGVGVEEKGYNAKGQSIVVVDSHYFDPTVVEILLGGASKAKQLLG